MDWIDEFVRLLFPEDPRKIKWERAYHLKYKHMPAKIYRYIKATPRNIAAVNNGQIWLGNPNKYNDPYDSVFTFDCQAIFAKLLRDSHYNNFNKVIPEYKDFLKENRDGILGSENPWAEFQERMLALEPCDERRGEMKFVINTIMNKLTEDIVSRQCDVFRNSLRVCSFSSRNDSLLMWSHYADNHRGLCIEYNMSNYKYSDNRSRFLYPVIYTNKLMDITDTQLRDSYNILRYTLSALVKADDWKYEREWRLIFAHGIIPEEQLYNMGKPDAIQMGARVSSEHQREITRIAERQNIDLYKMALSRDNYQLESRILKDADPFFYKNSVNG